MSKLTIDDLIMAIKLNRRSDDCGPGCPSRDEAIMIIKREWEARDAVIEAAKDYFKFTEETNATNDDCRKVFMTGWGNSLSRALDNLKAVQDA